MGARFMFFLLTDSILSCSGSKAAPIARNCPLTRITD